MNELILRIGWGVMFVLGFGAGLCSGIGLSILIYLRHIKKKAKEVQDTLSGGMDFINDFIKSKGIDVIDPNDPNKKV